MHSQTKTYKYAGIAVLPKSRHSEVKIAGLLDITFKKEVPFCDRRWYIKDPHCYGPKSFVAHVLHLQLLTSKERA